MVGYAETSTLTETGSLNDQIINRGDFRHDREVWDINFLGPLSFSVTFKSRKLFFWELIYFQISKFAPISYPKQEFLYNIAFSSTCPPPSIK